MEPLSKSLDTPKESLGDVKARLSSPEPLDREAQERVALVGQQQPLPQRRVLRAERGGKLPREASHQADLPAYLWTAGCGWPFGCTAQWQWAKEENCLAPGANLRSGGCELPEEPVPAASPCGTARQGPWLEG